MYTYRLSCIGLLCLFCFCNWFVKQTASSGADEAGYDPKGGTACPVDTWHVSSASPRDIMAAKRGFRGRVTPRKAAEDHEGGQISGYVNRELYIIHHCIRITRKTDVSKATFSFNNLRQA